MHCFNRTVKQDNVLFCYDLRFPVCLCLYIVLFNSLNRLLYVIINVTQPLGAVKRFISVDLSLCVGALSAWLECSVGLKEWTGRVEVAVNLLCNIRVCVCPVDNAACWREPHRVDGSPNKVCLAMQRHPAALRYDGSETAKLLLQSTYKNDKKLYIWMKIVLAKVCITYLPTYRPLSHIFGCKKCNFSRSFWRPLCCMSSPLSSCLCPIEA